MVVVLTNDELSPAINWSTLGPPFTRAVARDSGELVHVPRIPSFHDVVRTRRETGRDPVFWMQGSSRPEWQVTLFSVLMGKRRRSAFVVDAWPYALDKIRLAAELQDLLPCFVAFREAYEVLQASTDNGGRYKWLPFGVDTSVFRPYVGDGEKDIFAFWMGRRHEPLHQRLKAYCERRSLRYITSENGSIRSPSELGHLVSRSKYFVVTPVDLDHPVRAAGFSPLLMRYLEGLASGTKLLGVLPRSGEYEALLPQGGIVEVAEDGSDLEQRLDEEREQEKEPSIREISEEVRLLHSWDARALEVRRALHESD